MSAEAYDWLIVFVLLISSIAVCATIAAIVEWLERNRKDWWRRVPPPNWRSHRGNRDYW